MSMQVGVNTINQMLSKMCEQAGLEHRTNHSLRATGASDMFQANLPEHVIQSRTGHLSLKAFRTYERVTDEQQQGVDPYFHQSSPHASSKTRTSGGQRISSQCSLKCALWNPQKLYYKCAGLQQSKFSAVSISRHDYNYTGVYGL